jgi:pilus assembly protein CpaB
MLQGRIPLILAAIFSVLAASVAYLAVKERSDEIAQGWEPVKVLVAKVDLPRGTTLSQKNLMALRIPKRLVTPSVVTQKLFKSGYADILGQKVAIEMHAGDILLFQHVLTKIDNEHLAAKIQPNGRAMSIRVSAESSVEHWIEPADRIDIVGVFRDPRTRNMVSLTLFQNVIVLATGKTSGRSNRRLSKARDLAYSTVTVQVLPEAVEMLVLAQELGTLYLSLRNPEDNAIKDLGEGKTTMGTLLTGERSKRISTRQNKIFKVEIIRGRKREKQAVP